MIKFKNKWDISPTGDQPAAIKQLVKGIEAGVKDQVLLGVTGSGKTFTMANVIAKTNRPALVMAPNKTLAAQLFQEFKVLFPDNAVEYFVSYYDYYQPEAYLPSSDTFIDKTAEINDDIDAMRHSATRSLFDRRDVIIVSSVSCIYGLGAPADYFDSRFLIKKGMKLARDAFIKQCLDIQFQRNDNVLERGKIRVRGDTVEIVPSYEKEKALRVQFAGNTVEKISHVDALRGTTITNLEQDIIYPATHYLLDKSKIDNIIKNIAHDLSMELQKMRASGKMLEAARLEQRTKYDLEMIRELGYCQGIENYSRYLDNRSPGMPAATLLDYFPKDFLLFIDESHITTSQIGGMYRGDRARKETLVNFGFRLSSALDNRPLNFDEFKERIGQTVYVSATPGEYELKLVNDVCAEQLIRPTGLLDPVIEIKSATTQIEDLLEEVKKVIHRKARVLVTTLTKKMSEELTEYFTDQGIKVRYLHSEIDNLQRLEILRDLRLGKFDCLIGINLLREGLDLPEVELVAILDADKEGFLRSRTSLIQTVGRAARNVNGRVIMYANQITKSIRACLDETSRRRELQKQYNKEHKITPQTVMKKIPDNMKKLYNLDFGDEYDTYLDKLANSVEHKHILKSPRKLHQHIQKLTKSMQKEAMKMEFEKAAELRDQINMLKEYQLNFTSAPNVINSEK